MFKRNLSKVLLLVLCFGFLIVNSSCSNKENVSILKMENSTKTEYSDLKEANIISDTLYQQNHKEVVKASESISISFAGDVMLDGSVGEFIERNGNDSVFSGVNSIFQTSDINIVNLECPITDRGEKEKEKQYVFRAKPRYTSVLSKGQVNIVSLANNHILDYGTEGLMDTIKYLDEEKILHSGAGSNSQEAYSPIYVTIKDIKVAFIASSRVIPFSYWAAEANKSGVSATYDPKRILEEIIEAKNKADIIVTYIHWGQESIEMPLDYEKDLAKNYIDAGADIVVGSHPHVLQGFEYYKGKIIAYSLGNFVFTDLDSDSMILNVNIDKNKKCEVRVIPCKIENYIPKVISEKENIFRIQDKLVSLSTSVEINESGYITQKQ